MNRVLLIEEPDKYDASVAEDMRRWWRYRCRAMKIGGELLVEVGAPINFNLREGVKRLASFGVRARVVNRQMPGAL